MRLKSSVKLLLSVLLLIGVAGGMWLVADHRKTRERRLAGVPESRARLVEMLGSSRPFEGRLLGMSYVSFDPARARRPLSRSRLKEALAFANENRDETEAERLSNTALVYGLGNEFDLAIQTLTRATVSKGAKPWMWGDLAALYLARSKDGDFVEALNSSSRALQAGNAPPEVIFNQALCLKRLALVWVARKAWLRYIRFDSDSGWTDEARLHLSEFGWPDGGQKNEENRSLLRKVESINNEVAKNSWLQDAQATRVYGEELLGDWGDAWLQGKTRDANRLLAGARIIGRILSVRSGDSLLDRAVTSIDAASSYANQTKCLARAHALYKEGVGLLDEFKLREARNKFSRSRALFEAGGSPFVGWARLRVATCDIRLFNYNLALSSLKLIILDVGEADAGSLLGLAWWSTGLIYGILVRPVEALDAYRHSVEFFGRLREADNLAAAESLMATTYRDLGDSFLAWHYERKALHLLGQVHDSQRRFLILDEAAVLLEQGGGLAAALELNSEMTAESSAAHQTALAVASLRKRSVLSNELGLRVQATRSFERAKNLLHEIGDDDARSSLAGDLLFTEGGLLVDRSPARSAELLTSALQLSERTNNNYRIIDVLSRRARAYLNLGKLDLARQDLGRAVHLINAQHKEVSGASLQEQFLDHARGLFESMAMLELQLGDSREALGYVENLKSSASFTVSAHEKGSWASEGTISHIQAALPSNFVLVVYFFFGEKPHVWLVRHSEIRDFDLVATKGDLDRAIRLLKRGMEQRERGTFRGRMGLLWRQLIGSFSGFLNKDDRVVFVPDGPLYGVPFAALWDEERKRFLLQDHEVSMASSATAYVAAAERSRALRRGLTGILAVGDPAFERRLWPSLVSLRSSQGEVRDIASLYPHSKVLVGNGATARRIQVYARSSDVIHFAGHAVINEDQPLLSMLLLSSDGITEGPGVLYARDLYRYRLPRTRIIVLAACSSVGANSGVGEGLSGLVRPFLSAGVPTVVGSLWRIEDGAVPWFLVGFHRHLLRGESPSAALRLTQIDSLGRYGSRVFDPEVWASFQIWGA